MNLSGLTVVITRQVEQYAASAEVYQSAGAKTMSQPLIRIVREWDKRAEGLVKHLPRYDAWIATSSNGIRALKEACDALGIKPSEIPRGFVIGESSERAAEEVGLIATRPPAAKTALELAQWLAGEPAQAPRTALFVTSQLAGDVVPETLRQIGCNVDSVVLYQTLPTSVNEALWRNLLTGKGAASTAIVVYSPSAMRILEKNMSEYLSPSMRDALLACIGQTTAAWCESHGIKVDAVAASPTDHGIREALHVAWQGRQRSR